MKGSHMTGFAIFGTMGQGHTLDLYPELSTPSSAGAMKTASDPHGARVPRPPQMAIADPRLAR